MLLCRIVGHATSSVCHPSLAGRTLALCQRLDEHGNADGSAPVVAVDMLGGALHQRVLVTTDGDGAREALGDPKSPVRHSIAGLVDEPGEN